MQNYREIRSPKSIIIVMAIVLLQSTPSPMDSGVVHAEQVAMSGMTEKVDVVLPGEPYDLSGKRMLFTNRYYVRQGWLQWYDRKGDALSHLQPGQQATRPGGAKTGSNHVRPAGRSRRTELQVGQRSL